jgi:tetratricopeptide (TPR) repeat protein
MRIQPLAVLLAILLPVSLPACAQPGRLTFPSPPSTSAKTQGGPRFPEAMILAQTSGSDEIGLPAQSRAPVAPERAAKLPSQALSRELLYKFLLAEIAAQRGNVRLAARAYVELAQATRDPRVARRATELAMTGRVGDIAAEASSTWLDIEPDSQQAKQTLIAILVGNSRIQDAKPHLQRLLAIDKARTGSTFMQLHPLLSRYPDKNAAYELVRELAQPYQDLPEAHFAVAQAALAAEKPDAARTEVAQALALRPGFEPAAVLQSQFLQRESTSAAIAYLEGFLAENPAARDARLMYARLLAADKRPADARREFELIERDVPQNAEVAVMIGLLSLQMQDFDAAETRLKRAIDLQYRDADTLRFYLGQIAEERKQDAEALAWYQQVQSGEQLVPAAVRYAMILARQDKLAEAREYLRNVQPQAPEQRVLLIQAEAQVLRESKAYQEAFDVLEGALAAEPGQPEFLYDLAMAAERLDRLDVLESRLKELIAIRPDHAQAYNALGYTLADRNLRLDEAKVWIEKALALAPEDPFILDSMGWVEYRLGNVDRGLAYLRQAYIKRPDPEIAAHLGEVLWAKGERGEAERVWRESLKAHPANEELKAAMSRHLP